MKRELNTTHSDAYKAGFYDGDVLEHLPDYTRYGKDKAYTKGYKDTRFYLEYVKDDNTPEPTVELYVSLVNIQGDKTIVVLPNGQSYCIPEKLFYQLVDKYNLFFTERTVTSFMSPQSKFWIPSALVYTVEERYLEHLTQEIKSNNYRLPSGGDFHDLVPWWGYNGGKYNGK